MKRTSLSDVLTVAEASKAKGISENGIRIAIREGRLRAEQRGRIYLIRRRDLDAWQPVGHRPPRARAVTPAARR